MAEIRIRKWIDGKVLLYVVRSGTLHKVGVTSHFTARLGTLQGSSPLPVIPRLVRYIPHDRRLVIEKDVHIELAAHRSHGEWFSADFASIKAAVDLVLERQKKMQPWSIYNDDCWPKKPWAAELFLHQHSRADNGGKP